MRQFLLILIVSLVPVLCLAYPFEWPESEGGNGHFYEMIPAGLMTWPEARIAAESMVFQGMTGHLATMTSPEETNFVFNLDERTTFGAYLGGWQLHPENAQPGEISGWRWMTGETWIDTVPQWCSWEGCETGDYVSVTKMWYSGIVYYWESLLAPDQRQHFVVEYDGLQVVDPPPENPVATAHDSWGSLKSRYR